MGGIIGGVVGGALLVLLVLLVLLLRRRRSASRTGVKEAKPRDSTIDIDQCLHSCPSASQRSIHAAAVVGTLQPLAQAAAELNPNMIKLREQLCESKTTVIFRGEVLVCRADVCLSVLTTAARIKPQASSKKWR